MGRHLQSAIAGKNQPVKHCLVVEHNSVLFLDTVAAVWTGGASPIYNPYSASEDWYLLKLDGQVTSIWDEYSLVVYFNYFDFYYQCWYGCF